MTSGAVLPTVVFRVGYLFAGEHRRSDMGEVAKEVAEEFSFELHIRLIVHMDEIDILREGELHDLLLGEVQDDILQRIVEAAYDLLLAAPPCNTHTRALHANRWGPKPVRDRLHPMGFPWLTGIRRWKVEACNALILFTVRALRAKRRPDRNRLPKTALEPNRK